MPIAVRNIVEKEAAIPAIQHPMRGLRKASTATQPAAVQPIATNPQTLNLPPPHRPPGRAGYKNLQHNKLYPQVPHLPRVPTHRLNFRRQTRNEPNRPKTQTKPPKPTYTTASRHHDFPENKPTKKGRVWKQPTPGPGKTTRRFSTTNSGPHLRNKPNITSIIRRYY